MNDWEKHRSLRKIKKLIAASQLDLTGLNVYTEAGTGSYSITAALALLGGAKAVHCVAKDNRFGSYETAVSQVTDFLNYVFPGESLAVSFSNGHDLEKISQADIITNSNPLRPLNAALIERLHKNSIISLMYEPWELREEDIDLVAAKNNGIWVVGVNEMHPSIECFYSAGILLLKGMLQAGLEVHSNDVLLVCTNQLVNYALPVLAECCEGVDIIDNGCFTGQLPGNVKRIENGSDNKKHYDALLLIDSSDPYKWNISMNEISLYSPASIGSWDVCVQAMGDVQRNDFKNVKFIPEDTPPRGYMGMNPASLGVELVIRSYIAGLKAGEEAISFKRNNNEIAGIDYSAFEWIKPMENI
jgi:hypothetical protein